MKKYKPILNIIIIIMILSSLTACGSKDNLDKANDNQIKIITTLFPQYDFAKVIAQDKAEVSLLLPPGVEAHSYEPSPQDVVSIQKADVFIYTSQYMEPWAVKMVEDIGDENLKVINLSENLEFIESDGHDQEDHHPKADGKDPHTWLDPVYVQQMVLNITEALIEIDPDNHAFYQKNSEEYITSLVELDESFIETFKNTKKDTIIYAGHFAFGYFTERYGLKHISPYSGFSPNAEPTPNRIVELIETLEKSDIKVIYYEELVDPKVAKIISEQTGAKMILLHGAHNISKSELESDVSYLEIMNDNREKLKEGLGYEK